MHLPGPQWKSSVSQLPCKSAYVKKTNSHIGMKIMCNYQCPRPILLLQVYCVRACKPCDVWSSLLIGRHRHTSPSFAVLERLRDFPDLLPAHSRRACNENKNKMNSMSHPLCRCSTRRFCLEVKTWTRDLQWAQMFRVVSPPLGLDCLWRMTKWGGEQKHKTLDSFCSDLCSDATSGACCILYIARSPWARHFETPKPNPDAEVQAITARSWPFMWEPLRETSWAFATCYIISENQPQHICSHMKQLRIGSEAAGQQATAHSPLLYITMNDSCTEGLPYSQEWEMTWFTACKWGNEEKIKWRVQQIETRTLIHTVLEETLITVWLLFMVIIFPPLYLRIFFLLSSGEQEELIPNSWRTKKMAMMELMGMQQSPVRTFEAKASNL